jgi:membrane fusion protein (multidrug efflux system)
VSTDDPSRPDSAVPMHPAPPSPPARAEKKRSATPFIAGGLFVAALGGWIGVQQLGEGPAGPPGASSGAAAPSASAPPAPAPPVTVEGFPLAPKPFQVLVPATGTLAANESVAIMAELSRRVVRALAVDGARVKKGQVLFQLDGADLQAQARELRVRRKLLVDNEARQAKMLAEGIGTVAEHERVKSELELVDAQSASLGVTLARTTVRAPFAGRLGLRKVSEGALPSPSTVLVTLQDDSKIKVDFSLPERYASLVAVDQELRFRVAGNGKVFLAKVSAIEPVIDAESRSLRVRGITDNPDGELVVGAFVNVELALQSERGALLVPSIAVIPSLRGHGVWVAKEGKATLVEVELGVRTETEVEITKGLVAGDTVLTTGLLRLRPGAAVKLEAGAK